MGAPRPLQPSSAAQVSLVTKLKSLSILMPGGHMKQTTGRAFLTRRARTMAHTTEHRSALRFACYINRWLCVQSRQPMFSQSAPIEGPNCKTQQSLIFDAKGRLPRLSALTGGSVTRVVGVFLSRWKL